MDLFNALPWLQIHVFAVFATLTLVVLADAHGFLWMIGKLRTLPHTRMEYLHRAVWVGLGVIFIAGFSMFLSYPEYLLTLPAFQLKILFVCMLAVNAFIIGKHLKVATATPFAELSSKEKTTLLLSGLASTSGWVGAYICAQFLS